MIGLDYTERIAPAALKAAGCAAAFRYLSVPGWPKNLGGAEADELLAAGIAIVLNFETSATFMLGGYQAGVAAAESARAQARQLGAPPTTRIWYSADFDAAAVQIPVLLAFCQGAASVDGHAQVGVYGGLRVVQAVADAGFPTWQTVAWSGGVWDPRAVARQTGQQLSVGGVQTDVDVIIDLAGLGAWAGPTTGGDMAMTPQDAAVLWGYSHNDNPDVHQTLDNAAAWAGSASTKLDQVLAHLAIPSVDVNALAAALVPHLDAGATADQIATAVVGHLATTLAKG